MNTILRRFDKAEIARRQLGSALHLFLDDADPVSVHLLACAGAEIADALVEQAGRETFRSIALDANRTLTPETYRSLKSQYANAFKHFNDFKGRKRDDSQVLADFCDEVNDLALLIGWLDFGTATGALPVEAQCFEGWFFACNPDKLAPDAKIRGLDETFPGVQHMRRQQQKALLSRVIRKSRRNKDLMGDPKTERRALLLPNNLDQFEREPAAV